jgi:two-component system, OmpR family, phosphate regulon sensor histidine kinase PhoR
VLLCSSVIPLIIIGFYASSLFKDTLISNDTEILKNRTGLMKERIESLGLDSADYFNFANRFDKLSNSRITIINLNGKVLADSRENPSEMDNHSDRPEIIDALKNGFGVSERYSYTLKENYLYAAMPVYGKAAEIQLILRTGYPLTGIDKEEAGANTALIISVIFFSVIIAVVGYISIRGLMNPVLEIQSGARRYASGDYSKRIFVQGRSELHDIAESLNQIAKQLDEKLNIIGEQSNLQQAVLASMKEGVVAVDYDERILLLNKTAEDILGISDSTAHGKTLQEIIRSSEIQKFFKKIISEGNPQEAEIILQHEKDKFLQLSGTLLFDVDDKALGALVVFNDISNLKHLDTIKKDLVANVSHELKTPITTIKGFIETLREGAIEEPQNAERFLNIIAKHIDRLNLIIDDLLILSRLEDKHDETGTKVERILPVLRSVLEDYEFKAKGKKMNIEIQCNENLKGSINKNLMEQAIGNLLDNAIKYSDKKTKIEVTAKNEDGDLMISVKDSGYGIAEEHMPRLFERFYRIDKGRSREEGGTGLGLAIVKHIVNAMNGTIEVDSTPGKGSVFTIRIPGGN